MDINKKKQEIYEAMKKYIDENRCINIKAFRDENPQLYAIIPHYFGSVNNALTELNLIKITVTKHKTADKAVSLRDMLAFDMLEYLRKSEKSSLEEVAKKYGVSRPAINQLHKALKAAIDKNKNNIEEYNGM